MSEVVSMQNVESIDNIGSSINKRLERKSMDGSADEAQNATACILARQDGKYTQLALEYKLLDTEVGRNVPVSSRKEGRTAKDLFATLESERFNVFV